MALLGAGLICLVLVAAAWGAVAPAWVSRYNGPASDVDGANAIAVDGLGNVYVTGYSYGGDNIGFDYATIKYGPGGEKLWGRRYNGPGNYNDCASAIAVDGQGNVYVTGYSYGGDNTSYDYATIKYSPDGVRLWVRRYNGPVNLDDIAVALVVDGQGNVYVTGYSDAGDENGYMDYVTVKYGPGGEELWVDRYNGPLNSTDQPTAIALDGQGNVYVTGFSLGSGSLYDCATIKYSPGGERLWVKRYNGPANGSDEARAMAVDGQGNVYVAGWSESRIGYDCITIKYSTAGDQLWVKRYNGPGSPHDGAMAMALDGQGNVYVTGWSDGSTTGSDYVTIKYSPSGEQLWVCRYSGNGDDRAVAMAVDGQGNVYVTGYSRGSKTGYDYATIKYSPGGDRLWVQRYTGPQRAEPDPTYDHDLAAAIAVDSSGNVYVTGVSRGINTDYDYATIKYTQD
jgi:uncharacterized delta-60 repeat protein